MGSISRIFDHPDAAAARRARKSRDIVARFNAGMKIDDRPLSLEHWRITSDDPEVLDTLRALYGGSEPEEWETKRRDNLELLTDTSSVQIILDGPRSIISSFKLFGRSGKPIRVCDGIETEDGQPCKCGVAISDRKEAHRAGDGCQPEMVFFFELADAPDLGRMKFQTGSWTLVEDLPDIEDALTDLDGPALAELELEVVEFTTRRGEERRFIRPRVRVLGPYVRDED